MEATLTFPKRNQAEQFAIDWGRYSKRGHMVGTGLENVPVKIHDVSRDDEKWINDYIAKINWAQ